MDTLEIEERYGCIAFMYGDYYATCWFAPQLKYFKCYGGRDCITILGGEHRIRTDSIIEILDFIMMCFKEEGNKFLQEDVKEILFDYWIDKQSRFS